MSDQITFSLHGTPSPPAAPAPGGRVIVHVDVDAFFPSVEQLLIPALRGRPVIVGSGCIASCSYEARRFGLNAGMPLREAMRLCPQAVRLAGRYQTYRCFAEHIWEICRRYATSLETYLDEAYGDVKRLATPAEATRPFSAGGSSRTCGTRSTCRCPSGWGPTA